MVQPQKAAKKSPPVRRMIPVLNQPITMAKGLKLAPTPAKTFSIMTYNILARKCFFAECHSFIRVFTASSLVLSHELGATGSP